VAIETSTIRSGCRRRKTKTNRQGRGKHEKYALTKKLPPGRKKGGKGGEPKVGCGKYHFGDKETLNRSQQVKKEKKEKKREGHRRPQCKLRKRGEHQKGGAMVFSRICQGLAAKEDIT